MGQRNKSRRSQDATKAAIAPLDAAALERTQIAKYHTKGGHGFAAEDANNVADRLRGKDAKVVGQSNKLHGADRAVNEVYIQSKYHQDAVSTIQSAFDPHGGGYRYSGQLLEVPEDQYEQCVELMRKRISEGRVPGHTDPADAEKLVMKGTVTYKQARNIARAGNIDSVKFDVKTGAAVASGAFGLSFAVNYWQGRRLGMDNAEAIKAALHDALSAGLATLVTHVVSAQLLRTKTAAWGTVVARNGVRAAARTSVGKKAIEGIAKTSLRKAVHGAAAVNHVSKLLRSNILVGSVTVAVTCAPDFYRAAFDNSISWQQFIKNSLVNAASVAGGVGGWMAGAALGSVIPGVGTVVGGLVGGILGALGVGTAAGNVAKSIADEITPDDSEALLKFLEEELRTLSLEYMLSEQEVKQIIDVVRKKVDEEWLRGMYRETGGREEPGHRFVRREFEQEFEEIAKRRPRVAPLSVTHFRRAVKNLAELARRAT